MPGICIATLWLGRRQGRQDKDKEQKGSQPPVISSCWNDRLCHLSLPHSKLVAPGDKVKFYSWATTSSWPSCQYQKTSWWTHRTLVLFSSWNFGPRLCWPLFPIATLTPSHTMLETPILRSDSWWIPNPQLPSLASAIRFSRLFFGKYTDSFTLQQPWRHIHVWCASFPGQLDVGRASAYYTWSPKFTPWQYEVNYLSLGDWQWFSSLAESYDMELLVRVLRNVYQRVGCPQPHWYLYVLSCISEEPAPMIMKVGKCMISRGLQTPWPDTASSGDRVFLQVRISLRWGSVIFWRAMYLIAPWCAC